MNAAPVYRPTPTAQEPLNRSAVLAAVLDPRRLPTPPAVALRVVNAASRPDCDPDEIVQLLSQDPALCAKLLKAVNSCLFAPGRPIASLERAVTVLGLGPVRSLALGLSMPALRAGPSDPDTRNHQITSVAGAIIARDLSARTPRAPASDDMVAGLLRDVGAVLLQQTYPDAWRDMAARWGDRLLAQACEAEEETFGISHADVGAELLTRWKLPPELVEPIRFHHHPERLAGANPGLGRRVDLLYFSGLLASLDVVARHPHVLEYVLDVSLTRYGLPKAELIEFMRGIVPKITAFGELLNRDVRDCPNFAEALAAGGQELVSLAVAANRTPLSGHEPPPPRARAATSARSGARVPPADGRAGATGASGPELPDFQATFLDRFPAFGCRLGEYELREELGRGAMGVVYKGYEPGRDRFVAIKTLRAQTCPDPTARARFAREARAGAAIRHENVVAVYSVGESAGLPYLAMEYVPGVPLDRYIEAGGPVPVPVIARIGRELARGLSAAHQVGIVHRDVKPGNVLIEDRTGAAKIADFGLARAADDAALSQTGALIGTPNYMAPEQARGGAATAASDLFALGGVLYTLCTGAPPFPGSSPAAVLHAVCSSVPTPIRRVRADIPPWLEGIISRLLEKYPTRRFQSASVVAAALTDRV